MPDEIDIRTEGEIRHGRLRCSPVALSDIVYISPEGYLADPHVQVELVAADGGPITWPLHISLLLAKEYAFTGARIPAQRPSNSFWPNIFPTIRWPTRSRLPRR